MDDPVTSSQRGSPSARRRSNPATASARVVDLAGLPALIDADGAIRSAAVDGLLAQLPDSGEPPQISISFTGEALGLPDREPDEVNSGVSVWRDDQVLMAAHPDGLSAVSSSQEARIAGDAEDPVLAFRHLFQVVATHLLAYHDRFLLHGGAIACERGAYIVLGPTGAGKSSLTVAATAAQWRVMSDDFVVVRQTESGVEVTGIPRPWVVPADLAAEAGLPTRPAAADARERRIVDGLALTSGWQPAAGTVLVGHGRDPAPADAISAWEALTAILGSFFCASDPVLLRRFFPAATAVSRLPAWSLRHPVDPAQRLASAVRNLQDICRP